MKFAFSTLGCPDWSWNDILSTAKDMGFDGIEIRGIQNELYAPHVKQFRHENLPETLARLEQLKLPVVCLTSACYLFQKAAKDQMRREGRAYIDLAETLHVPYIRVMGDKNPQPEEPVADAFVAEGLQALSEYAKGKHVTLLIETNGAYADSARLMSLLELAGNQENIGVLWDIHHPFRYFGEPPKATYEILGKKIKYLHVKDSVIEPNGGLKYKMMGQGDIPISEALQVLTDHGYDGYISLEWVKRWYADLEAPGVVFMQFMNYMQRFFTQVKKI